MPCKCFPTREYASKAALALAGALCVMGALAPVDAAPGPIMLSDVARGTGGFVINGSFQYGLFGSVVSGGADGNGDGLSDVLVGLRPSNSASNLLPDVNHVVFGKSDGTVVNLSTLVSGGPGGNTVGQTLVAAQPWLRLGFTAGWMGDVNGDGLADLVTSPQGVGSFAATDRRFVVFGRPDLGRLALSSISAGTGGFAMRGGTVGLDVWGPRVCDMMAPLGDVNGDGLGDVLMAGSSITPPRSFVVFGRTTTGEVPFSTIDAGTGGFVILNSRASWRDRFVPAGVGDINGDGLGDIAIHDANSDASHIVFGKTSTTPVDLSNLGSGPGRPGWRLESTPGARYRIVGAGDTNGDSLGDMLLSLTSSGTTTYLVFGRTQDTDVIYSDLVNGTGAFKISADLPTILGNGSACEAGDLNGDGLADIAVGGFSNLLGGGGNYQPTGGAYVVFGRTTTTNVTIANGVFTNAAGLTIRSANSRARWAGAALAPGGDIDGDGLADLVVGAPYSTVDYSSLPARLNSANVGTGQIYAIFNPLDPAATSTYIANVPAGNPGAVGPGGRTFGRDTTIHVDSRAWVDFADGTGPGPAGSSTLGVTITRSDAGIGGGLSAAVLGNVQWSITSNRTNTAAPRVSVRYTNDEIAGLNEGGLQLLAAPTAAGPFVPVGSPQANAARNMLSGTATLPAVFVIVDVSPRATITRLNENPTLDQNPAWQVTFDRPVAPSFTLLDIMPTGSLASSNLIDLTLTGLDPTYVVRAITSRSDTGGTIGFTIPAGAVSSGGLVNTATEAPPYTIQAAQPAAALAGDMNKDSVVNVADVTALANHIVNGTPLP